MNFDKLSQYLTGFSRENNIPAFDCAVYAKHEQIYRFRQGYSDFKKEVPVSPFDGYWIYSTSKVCAAAAAMQMMERGLFKENQPVADYLPEFSELYYTRDGKAEKCKKVLRIVHLLTMRGGYEYNISQKLSRYISSHPEANCRDIVAQFAKEQLYFEPGEHFAYSWCMDILGAVMEAASGKTLSQWMQEELFEPLGMKNTTFHPSAEQLSRMSAQYVLNASGEVMEDDSSNFCCFTPMYESAGAGLYSTVDDYILLADALACGGVGKSGARILSENSVKKFQTNLLGETQLADFRNRYRRPGYGYGYGTRVCISELNHEPKGTFGWDGAAGAHVLIDPVHQISMVYFQHVLDMEFIYDGIFPVMDRLLYEGLR